MQILNTSDRLTGRTTRLVLESRRAASEIFLSNLVRALENEGKIITACGGRVAQYEASKLRSKEILPAPVAPLNEPVKGGWGQMDQFRKDHALPPYEHLTPKPARKPWRFLDLFRFPTEEEGE